MKRKKGRAKESLMVLRDMVGEKVRSKPRYRCQKWFYRIHPSTGIVRLVGLVNH